MSGPVKRQNAVSECERFAPGTRLREICEGTPDLPLDRVNQYRERWGMEPLTEDEVPPRQILAKSTPGHMSDTSRRKRSSNGASKGCTSCGGKRKAAPKPNGWGPGSQLLKDFESAGVPHCQDCIDLAGHMDRWGKRGCEKRLDQIVAEMLPRAREWMSENQPFLHRLFAAVKLEDAALKLALRKKVQKAIDKTPNKTTSRPRKKPERKIPERKKRSWKPRGNWISAFKPGGDTPEYLSTERLASDTLSLVPRLPPDITQIAAVSRSGLAPGTLLSMALHLPMIVIRHHQGDWMPAGNGWRLNEGTPKGPGRILVVDDTTMTGNSLKRTKHVIEKMPGEKLYAAVYVNPAAVAKPDMWAMDLPWPHLLEWNLFNSVLLDSFALDFDGILCHDCPAGDDDDGPRYETFLREVPPLHIIRKRPAKLIVTARLEKYRPQTLEWMEQWGVKAKTLIMGPWKSLAERRGSDVAAWKAGALQKFLDKRGSIPPQFYVESDRRQAKRIAELTGRLVVCPPAGQCFGKATK